MLLNNMEKERIELEVNLKKRNLYKNLVKNYLIF